MSSLRANETSLKEPKTEFVSRSTKLEKPKPEKGTKVVRRKCETVLDSRQSESLMEIYQDTKVKRQAR
jgi:hypothetical protein